MQRVRLEREPAVLRGRDRELLVAVIEQVLRGRDLARVGQRAAHLGARAVGREHDVGVEPPRAAIGRLDQRRAVGQVDADAGFAETVLHAVAVRGDVVQQRVQRRARHGVDFFRRALAVTQEPLLAARLVQHAAAHRDHEARDLGVDAGTAQRRDAARGECEVDRAAARLAGHERRAALDDGRDHAAAREQDREQAAGRAAADDRDTRRRAHASSVRFRAVTAS